MKLFLVAGEPSGDRLGAALIKGMLQNTPAGSLQLRGVGGPLMQACGMASIFPIADISLMGIGAILRNYPRLRQRLRQTIAEAIAWMPDVLVTIDLPEFCLRVSAGVADAARNGACPRPRMIHYVAPTVWAWRPGRAQRMARHVDHVLALFPFEPPFMQAAGMKCDFVGHPVAAEPCASPQEIASFRTSHGLEDAKVMLVLPGSRQSEIAALGARFGAATAKALAARKGLRAVLLVAPAVRGIVHQEAAHWSSKPILLDQGVDAQGIVASNAIKRAALACSDIALAASGTISLELAANQTPMVSAYDMGWLSRQVIGRLLHIDTVNLVNLTSETRIVPEFLGPKARPAPMAQALLQTMDEPSAQLAALDKTMERLGRGGPDPGLRAAKAILARL